MKKLLFISAITLISAGTFAQGKSGKNKEKNTEWRKDSDDRQDKKDKDENRDERDERRDDMKDKRDDRNENHNDNRKTTGNRYGKYSKNTPRKVGDAFRRDYPNATNVSWTKDQGVWTASFGGGGLFNGNKTVSYRANGERVGQVAGRTGIGSIFNQR